MAEVQTSSPVRSAPGSAGVSRFSPTPPGSRPGTRQGSASQPGSRPASREGFSGSRPSSQIGSRPTSKGGSAGRYRSQASGSRPMSRSGSGSRTTPKQQPSPLSDRPESTRSLASRASMPDHLRPLVKTAVKRWKRFHEQHVMERLKERREEKKQRIQLAREEKQKLARRIPIDVLAKEWLNENEATVEVRAYLLEKLLPVLIMGVEKLLREADKRGLPDKDGPDPNFNPINFLAQYLMRNNPRYSNFPEASPYIRGLQDVTEELKKEVFSFEDNRLARVKAEARRRREERMRDEKTKSLESHRRSATLREQYKEWVLEEEGRLELNPVQEALRSFAEITENYPEELRKAAQYGHELEASDDSGKTISIQEFSDYIKKFVTDMPSEIFLEFLKHLSKCAIEYHAAANREGRREILSNLFLSCDHSGVGLLDRHRVLALFESFYDGAINSVRKALRNPRKWPIVELDEVTDYADSVISEESNISELQHTQAVTEEEAESEKEASKADEEEKEKDTTSAVEQTNEDSAGGEPPAEEGEKVQEQAAEGEAADGEQKETTKDGEQKAEEKDEASEEPKEEPAEEKKEETAPEGGQAEAVAQEQKDEPAAEEQKDETVAEEKEGEAEKPAETGTESEEVKVEEKEEAEAAEEKKEENVDEAQAEEKTEDAAAAAAAEEEVKEETAKEEEAKKEETKDEETKDEETKEEGATKEGTTEEKPEETVAKETQEEETKQSEEAAQPEESAGEEKAATETQEKEEKSEQEDAKDETKPEAKEGEEDDLPIAVEDDEAQPTGPTGRASVTFAEGAVLYKEKTKSDIVKTPTTRSGSVAASAFDENFLNISQFVQLVESFLGDEDSQAAFDTLLDFIKAGYVETEEEKMFRLKKARKEAQSAKRKLLLDQLFERWDNDGSGYLELEEILTVLGKYKENMEHEAIEKAKKVLSKDDKLSKREFRKFTEAVCLNLPGGEDNFEPVIEFLTTSIERTYAERIRGQARKKWLSQIIIAAETGGANMEPVYKALFSALYKDAEAHGGNKRISASISMLENNDGSPARGNALLRYSATTPDDAQNMLGKALYKDMKGISFASIESGKPIHVPRVKNHGNIHFWNPERAEEERDGSFIVIPLKDQQKRVFGLMGIDTLADPHAKSIFITHEISFFQGVAKAFSTAFHHVDIRRKTLRIAESALSWIHRRSPSVFEINVYIVEPDEKFLQGLPLNAKFKIFSVKIILEQQDYVLRKMITTNRTGQTTLHNKPMKLERKDNLFRDYLFKCVDNSETITADAYGERHTAFPLRDSEGHAVAVVDISIGELRQLPNHENREVQRMLKLLQLAHREVAQESAGADKTYVLEAEKKNDEDRINVLFDRIMLTDLRENVAKLDARAFAELKSYKDPPKIIHDILISVLSVFYADKALDGEFEAWSSCKQYVNTELTRRIMEFDPTAAGVIAPSESVHQKLANVPHGAVAKHGSLPAQHLYNWAFVCLSLLEHSAKTREAQKPRSMTPPKSATQSVLTEDLIT
ncbi:EF-hand calcium-binding domain-containing protein 5-like isoform X2 [Ptychodera flava]|uniref:EF-hand calcium-binding domain-containing protein 5-like isoform X2 n=1 Tax=Ptychodera flava TaxID=63121 RepID=UPI00396A6CE7